MATFRPIEFHCGKTHMRGAWSLHLKIYHYVFGFTVMNYKELNWKEMEEMGQATTEGLKRHAEHS